MNKPTISTREALAPIWATDRDKIRESFEATGTSRSTFYRRINRPISGLLGEEIDAIVKATGVPIEYVTIPNTVFIRLEDGQIATAVVSYVAGKEGSHE